MLILQNAAEPAGIRNALADIVAAGTTDIRVASAYVTLKGAEILLSTVKDAVGPEAFNHIPKTLATSFDFGVTEPKALEHWLALGNSKVLVSGEQKLKQGLLTPQQAFHPKLYAFGIDSETCSTLVGSANLTSRGLSVNTEAAWVQHGVSRCTVDAAFEKACFGAINLTGHLLKTYKTVRHANPPPSAVNQEAQPVAKPKPVVFSGLQLFKDAIEIGSIDPLSYAIMWVQVEALQGGSQNQLELPRGGHRFFGFAFDNYQYPHNQTIGKPILRRGAHMWDDRPLTWHGNNGMERMNLPTAAQGGFDYTDKAIMFRRLPHDIFELIAAPWDSDLARSWLYASSQLGTLFRLGKKTNRVVGLIKA